LVAVPNAGEEVEGLDGLSATDIWAVIDARSKEVQHAPGQQLRGVRVVGRQAGVGEVP
jgi:hypothetical protein